MQSTVEYRVLEDVEINGVQHIAGDTVFFDPSEVQDFVDAGQLEAVDGESESSDDEDEESTDTPDSDEEASDEVDSDDDEDSSEDSEDE